jgi:hypothetical protein
MTTTKADPKPGRWILPLVIIGMVIFTYVFVGNIRDNTEPADIDISLGTGSTDTTQPATGSSTPTTQPTGIVVDAESIAYLERITELDANLTALDTTMLQTNDDFDARTVAYAAARDEIRDTINPGFVSWAADVKATVAPDSNTELTALSTELAGRADSVVQATIDILAGLQSSDTGEARAAALADLKTQVEGFNAAVAAANS